MDRENFLSNINKVIINSQKTAEEVSLRGSAANDFVDKNVMTFVRQVAQMEGVNKQMLDLVVAARPSVSNDLSRSFPGVLGIEVGLRSALHRDNIPPARSYSSSGCGGSSYSSGSSCGGSSSYRSSSDGCGGGRSYRPSSNGCGGGSSRSSGSSCGGGGPVRSSSSC